MSLKGEVPLFRFFFLFPLDNVVNPLGNQVTTHAECQKTCGNRPEPFQVPFVLLAGNPHVHAPQTSDNVHGQNNGTQYGQLAEDIGRLLLSLVHANVDLSQVVAVRSRKDPKER